MKRELTSDDIWAALAQCEVHVARLAGEQLSGDVVGMARELFSELEHTARKLVHYGDRVVALMTVQNHPVWRDYEARLRRLRAFLACFP